MMGGNGRLILSLTPFVPHAAGPACGCSNSPRRIRRLRRQSLPRTWSGDAGANVGAADGPKGEAQDVPSNRWVLIPVVTTRKAKRPTRGRFAFLAERVGFEPTEGLTLRRFSRLLPC